MKKGKIRTYKLPSLFWCINFGFYFYRDRMEGLELQGVAREEDGSAFRLNILGGKEYWWGISST